MSKKRKQKKGARKGERQEWTFIQELHKASVLLPPEKAYIVVNLIGWHRENGYLTPKQVSFGKSLINESKAKKEKAVKRDYFLYAISDETAVKIGFSNDPNRRLRDMQTGHPVKLKLLWKLLVSQTAGLAVQAERKLHRFCKKYRKRGEWYSPECMVIVQQFELKDKAKKDHEVEQDEAAELEIAMAAKDRL